MSYRPQTLEEAVTTLEGLKARYLSSIEDFKKKLTDDPLRAFEWSETAVQSSVRLREVEHLLESFNKRAEDDNRSDEEVLSFLAEHYGRDAINAAQRIERSTSVMHNMVADHKRAFVAALYAWFAGIGFPSL